MNHRQDAWSDNDDRFLAQTVLKHIREGSTQLRAFDEIGDALDRTSAACGFRWNALIRQKYEQEIKEAKRERKRRMRVSAKKAAHFISPHTQTNSPLTVDQVVIFLQELIPKLEEQSNSSAEETEKEIHTLQNEKKILEEEIEAIKKEFEQMKRDYDVIVNMMNRARKMAAGDDITTPSMFRMDANGNLENMSNESIRLS